MSQTWTTIIQNVPKLFTELLCQRTDQRTLLWWRWDTEYNFIRWIKICFIFPSFFLFPKCTKSSGPIIEFGSFQVLDLLRVKRWDLQISQPRFFICWTVSLFIHIHLVFLYSAAISQWAFPRFLITIRMSLCEKIPQIIDIINSSLHCIVLHFLKIFWKDRVSSRNLRDINSWA